MTMHGGNLGERDLCKMVSMVLVDWVFAWLDRRFPRTWVADFVMDSVEQQPEGGLLHVEGL